MEQNMYGEWLKVEYRYSLQIRGTTTTEDVNMHYRREVIDGRATASKPQGLYIGSGTCLHRSKCWNSKTLVDKDIEFISDTSKKTVTDSVNHGKTCGVPTPSQKQSSLDFGKYHKSFPVNKEQRKSELDQIHAHNYLDIGYDVFEYVVERVDQRLLAVLKLPLLVVALIVILWSFSLMSSSYTICLVLLLGLLAYIHAWNTIVEETLTVTSTVGIQVQQTNILGKLKYAKYVPIENIKAVVINEIIRRQRVISYLLIVLEAAESTGKVMVPLLTGTLPRLRTIENIYQNVQKVIY